MIDFEISDIDRWNFVEIFFKIWSTLLKTVLISDIWLFTLP